jgi:hypothetical protein
MDDERTGTRDGERASNGQPVLLLEQWRNGVRLSHIAHSQARTFYRRLGRILGTSAVVLSSVVGTTIFVSLQSSPDLPLKVATGTLSVAAAVVAALQTFLGYPELADRHRQAALAYGVLRRRLDQRLSSANPSVDQAFLDEIRSVWDQTDSSAPSLPQWIHNRALRRVKAAERPDE